MTSNRKRLEKRTLFVLAGVLAVQTVICAGVVMSAHVKKAALEQTLAGKETALNNVRTVSAGLPALQAQYGKMVAQVRCLERALPQPEYIPTLLGDIERTAAASGVKIQEFRPKAASPQAGTTTTTTAAVADTGSTQQQFDMTVEGGYGQIQKFLQNLTRFRKILALNSIKLQPKPGAEAKVSPTLTGTLTLTAYVLTPSAADAAPVAPVATSPASAAVPAAAKLAASRGITVSQPTTRG